MSLKGGSKIFLSLILLTGLVVAGLAYYKAALKKSPSKAAQTEKFVIEQGENVAQIAQRLEEEGLVNSSNLFKIYLSINNLAGNLQAGEYYIPKNLSLIELVNMLQHGTFSRKVTIIEGLRSEEIAKILEKEVGISSKDFMLASKDLEGKLFPETYYFEKGITVSEIVEKMLATYDTRVTEEVKNQAAKKGFDEKELLTLASIVEREAAAEKDRFIVAGILAKRISEDWPIQADATMQYALGSENNWWAVVTSEDLKKESAYNTYLNKGLPPAPICNPSLSAIKATADYLETSYWYYLTGSDGEMHYAETLEEHNENIANFL